MLGQRSLLCLLSCGLVGLCNSLDATEAHQRYLVNWFLLNISSEFLSQSRYLSQRVMVILPDIC